MAHWKTSPFLAHNCLSNFQACLTEGKARSLSNKYAAMQERNISEKHILQDSQFSIFIYSVFYFMEDVNYESSLEV